MESSLDVDKTCVAARAVLKQMEEGNSPATPDNHSRSYCRFNVSSSEQPCRTMRPPSADDADGDVAEAEQHELNLGDVSAKVEAAIATLMSGIGAAGQDTRHFGAALDGLARDLTGNGGPAVLQKAVAGVLMETCRMLEKTKALEERLAESSDEVRALRERMESARREAMTDALTGIANRKALNASLRLAAREAARQSSELCLLMVDIDHFKRFNDTYGHALGDQVLRLVAKALVDNVKGRDLAARYGGEEFCIVLPNTRLADAMTVAEQLRLAVGRKKIIRKGSTEDYGSITMSIGVARLSVGESVAQLIQRADSALYFAKRNGRNRVASEDELPEASPKTVPG